MWQARRVAEGMSGFNKWLIGLLRIDVLKSQGKALGRIKASRRPVDATVLGLVGA